MSGPSVGAHLVLLQIGRTRIALAQQAVRSLEAASDMELAGAPSPALGTIDTAGSRWPVFALDDEFAPLGDVPRHRRICAVLAVEGGSFGLLCDEAQVLPRHGRSAYPLPAAMRRADSPVDGVIALGREVALLASVRALARITGASACFAERGTRSE